MNITKPIKILICIFGLSTAFAITNALYSPWLPTNNQPALTAPVCEPRSTKDCQIALHPLEQTKEFRKNQHQAIIKVMAISGIAVLISALSIILIFKINSRDKNNS